jgi:hypothetical protein
VFKDGMVMELGDMEEREGSERRRKQKRRKETKRILQFYR